MTTKSFPEGVRLPSTDSSSFLSSNDSEKKKTSKDSRGIGVDSVFSDYKKLSPQTSTLRKHVDCKISSMGSKRVDRKSPTTSARESLSMKFVDKHEGPSDAENSYRTTEKANSSSLNSNATSNPPVFTLKADVGARDGNFFPFSTASNSVRFVRSETTANIKGGFTSGTALKGSFNLKNQDQPQQQRQQFIKATTYAEHLALVYFGCHLCRKIAHEPVQIQIPDRVLACKSCAVRNNSPFEELPSMLLAALQDVCGKAGIVTGNHQNTEENTPKEAADRRRIIKVVRPTPKNGSSSSGINNIRSSRGNSPQKGLDPTSNTCGITKGNAPTSAPTPGETVIESKSFDGGEKDVNKPVQVHPEAKVNSASELPTRRSGAEDTAKRDNMADNAGIKMDSTAKRPTSRQVKIEADKKYEDAEYAAAIELYTKAIKLQPLDKIAQLKHLYGNRSAAYFMNHQYAECISDCLEVIHFDPINTKMLCRAARSAATMGDLSQAIELLEKTPSEQVANDISIELAKYKSGLDIYQRAERSFGTPEGEERYRMLVAQFSDTVPFRVRYAESLMKQKQYIKAIETLDVVAASARTLQLCKIMAMCLYQSGFEYFERARLYLAQPSRQDKECEELLKLIQNVDEGKQKGNNAFASKDFSTAVASYTAAIELARNNDQILRILYCNRAAAHKELGNYRDGIKDCSNAIMLDKDFCKAYARRARCYEHLGDHFAAVQDFKKALEYDSSNRELAKELKGAEHSLSKETELEKDFYFQLGLPRTASEKEIKVKYRELSLRWHPDKCIGLGSVDKQRSEHKFKVISEAYATLINPSKRREYDLKMSRERLSQSGMHGVFSASYGSSGENFRSQNRHRAGPGGFW